MLLARNRTNGHLVDNSLTPPADLVFGGGFFQPFVKLPDNGAITPAYQLANGGVAIDLEFPGASICTYQPARRAGCQCFQDPNQNPPDYPPARENYWDFTAAFQALSARKINLVRVFGMNGTSFYRSNDGIIDVYPFNRDAATSKLLVQAAVEGNTFNHSYFDDYLRPFVQQANQFGIAVQLCLFSFHDFTNIDDDYFKYYSLAPWNAAGTLPQTWGDTYLIPSTVANDPISRNIYFTDINHAIWKAQAWWIGCVLVTLKGLGNVILELFNEPRSVQKDKFGNVTVDARARLAAWYDKVVNYMTPYFRSNSWRPLLSANPVFDDKFGESDVDVWKRLYPATFAEVDILSYHGLTGLPTIPSSPCGSTGQFSPVTPADIRSRISTHKMTFNDRALLFSTDAVKNLTHIFADSDPNRPGRLIELSKRDGQIRTSLADDAVAQPATLVSESDLENWAYWSFVEMLKPENRGQVHFQNHSILRASFDLIAAARVKAMNMGTVVQPAYATADWSQYSMLSEPNLARNFTWAQRFLVAEGGSVTQLGTQTAPQDPRWEMTVETGWRCNFGMPAKGWCSFHVAYTPVSVSLRSQGALVTPFIVARLHEVAANGALLPALVKNQIVVAPSAAPGMLSVCADLAAKQYALVFAGGVTVNYHNRYQGYGEVIVHFPSVRKVVL
jgi:hypothetical protein